VLVLAESMYGMIFGKTREYGVRICKILRFNYEFY
jgi:hypothetical protein